MPLSIKDPEADRLARVVAARLGKSITQVIIEALQERLAREDKESGHLQILEEGLVEEILTLGKHCSKLEKLSNHSDEEILGYDGFGIPK